MVDANLNQVFVKQMLVVQFGFLEWSCDANINYLCCLKVGKKHYLEITKTLKIDNDDCRH